MLKDKEQFNPLAGMDLSNIQGMQSQPQTQAPIAVQPTQSITVQFNSMAELEELLILRMERMQGLRPVQQKPSESAIAGFLDVLKWGIPTLSVAGILLMAMSMANRPNAQVQQAMQQQTAIALVAARQKPSNVTCIMLFGECPRPQALEPVQVAPQPPIEAPVQAEYQPPVQRWETHQVRQKLNFRQDPGGKVRFALPPGTVVQYQNEVRNLKGASWAKVKVADGRAGWVDINLLASL